MKPDRLLTLPEIAEITRIPIDTLRWYRHKSIGPKMFRLGRRIVAKESDVLAWIEDASKGDSPAA